MAFQSPFTWLALIVFTGLVALMLQRSAAERPIDKLWHYAPPALGCAVVDYVGTRGYVAAAVIGLILIVAYIITVLKPHATF